MAYDRFPSMHEDLSADPEHARVQALMRQMIEEGIDPKLVVDAALTTATALNVDLAGLAATACHLMQVGATMAQAAPEVREASAQFSAVLTSIIGRLGQPGAVASEARH